MNKEHLKQKCCVIKMNTADGSLNITTASRFNEVHRSSASKSKYPDLHNSESLKNHVSGDEQCFASFQRRKWNSTQLNMRKSQHEQIVTNHQETVEIAIDKSDDENDLAPINDISASTEHQKSLNMENGHEDSFSDKMENNLKLKRPISPSFTRSFKIRKWIKEKNARVNYMESKHDYEREDFSENDSKMDEESLNCSQQRKKSVERNKRDDFLETLFYDVPQKASFSSYLAQDRSKQVEIRLNALRDKLRAKGRNVGIIEILESYSTSSIEDLLKGKISQVEKDVCLLWSCIYGNYEMARMFLNFGANSLARDADGFSCLHLATESGNLNIIKLLLARDVKVKGASFWDNLRQITPLMLAANNGYTEVLSTLIKNGVKVDDCNEPSKKSAIHFAVSKENIECVDILIKAGARLNPPVPYSITPLHLAVEKGNFKIVDVLLKAGASTNVLYGINRISCLHISAKEGYANITSQLLKAGADPNQMDSRGKTPLHVAARSQCLDSVQILMKWNANPNIKDSEGKTPLHAAIFKQSQNFECLKCLLHHDADVNIADNAGYTPLHLAALNDSTSYVKLFLKHGADLTQTTAGGITAFNIIYKRIPNVINDIHEGLNKAINFVEHDNNLEFDGQIQLDFRTLISNSGWKPECQLMSCFIEEGQKNLLKHPLCEIFLYLKWLRVRPFFVINAVFYAAFVLVLTQYFYLLFTGTSDYHHDRPNRTYLHYVYQTFSQSDSRNSSILDLGRNLSYHSWLQSTFKTSCMDVSPNFPRIAQGLLYVIWVMLSLLFIKEGFQMLDSPKFYLKSFDNVLVWPVIAGAFCITLFSYYTNKVCPWEFHVAAIIILFCWIQLLILIGRFPLFGIYVHMFTQVSKNFGKFLFTYICLINAFSFSFGILFHNQPPFKHQFIRLLKTLVMMTGEIEYDEWFYENNPEERILYKGTSHFVFALFLLFGTIVLMNLLVGLAVSDIQGLQKSAGLDRLVRQTQLITHFESFMLSRWLKFFLPSSVLRILHNRILLLTSVYGNIFILNSNNSSNVDHLPREITDNIRRIAKSRDHLSRRKNRFAEFRTLSSTFQSSSNTEGDISRNIEVLKLGLEIVVWEMQDFRHEIENIAEKVDKIGEMKCKK